MSEFYRVIQAQKSILGDRPPEKEANWNHPDYVKIREALKALGYDAVEVCAASHVWQRMKFRSLWKTEDDEAIRVHGYSGGNIWITPYAKYAQFDLSKTSAQIAKDILYYFGHGNLDW